MNSDLLMDFLGEIDDDIILEAEAILPKRNLIKIANNKTLKWFMPVAACLAILITAVIALPNLYRDVEIMLTGNIIVGDVPDGFNPGISSEEVGGPVYISPMLRQAIETAKPGDLIKTIVNVPGYWDYLYVCEIDGVSYWDFYLYVTGGEWKHDETNRRENSAQMWDKLNEMEEAAYRSFREKAITDLTVKIGAFEVTDDEYFERAYTFIANLSPEQIFMLEEEKVYMMLWSPNWHSPVYEPDGFGSSLEPAIDRVTAEPAIDRVAPEPAIERPVNDSVITDEPVIP